MTYTEKDIFEGAILSVHGGKYEYLITNIKNGTCTCQGLTELDRKEYPLYTIHNALLMLNEPNYGGSFVKNKPEIYEIY